MQEAMNNVLLVEQELLGNKCMVDDMAEEVVSRQQLLDKVCKGVDINEGYFGEGGQ